MLLLADVYVYILRLGAFAYDHALVHLRARADEQRAAALGVIEAVSHGLARFERDERASAPARKFALVGLVFEEHRREHALALGGGQKLALVAEEAARGNYELQPGAAAHGTHVQKFALPLAHALEYRARKFVGHVDDKTLHGLALYAVYIFIEHARRGNLELVTLAAHVFYQNGEVHLAPAAHAVAVGRLRLLHAEGYVL